jgi:hypothetical protein
MLKSSDNLLLKRDFSNLITSRCRIIQTECSGHGSNGARISLRALATRCPRLKIKHGGFFRSTLTNDVLANAARPLKGFREPEHPAFIEMLGQYLHPHRQSARCIAARYAHAGNTGQIPRDGVDIG